MKIFLNFLRFLQKNTLFLHFFSKNAIVILIMVSRFLAF